MKISIIGAGAMGVMYGGFLADSGQHVTLIDIRRDVIDTINRDGLRIDGTSGDRHVKVDAVMADDATGPADVVIVQAHTDGTAEAAQLAAHLLTESSFAITLQNGIGNVESLVHALGPKRVLGGISYNSVTGAGPGHATHTNSGLTWIGELDGSQTDRVQTLCEVFNQAGLETKISGNIMGVIWNKLVVSCAIHPISALSGLMAGEIATVPAANELQDKVLEEILAVVHAKGIALSDDDPIGTIKKISKTVLIKPSILQHIEQGRPTEIDSQNGALLREAEMLGIPVPYNHTLTLMVNARSAQTAKQSTSA